MPRHSREESIRSRFRLHGTHQQLLHALGVLEIRAGYPQWLAWIAMERSECVSISPSRKPSKRLVKSWQLISRSNDTALKDLYKRSRSFACSFLRA